MLFDDDDLSLIINKIKFKAYLEDSDISYEAQDQQLPFVPTSFTNDSMAIRITQKAKFTFNVFSETRFECATNYKNLQKLLTIIKPSYEYVNDQLMPRFSNVTGFIDLSFKGLPDLGHHTNKNTKKSIISKRDKIKLHLNNFSYNVNKDLGFIHIPRSELLNANKPKFDDKDSMKLIPVGYKITMEGKVLLSFEQTANVSNSLSSEGKPLTQEQYATYLKNRSERTKLLKKLQEDSDFLKRLKQREDDIKNQIETQQDIDVENNLEFNQLINDLGLVRDQRNEVQNNVEININTINGLNISSPIEDIEFIPEDFITEL